MVRIPRMHLTVGVTGHRDLVAEDLPALNDAVRDVLQGLQKQFPELRLRVLSPLAEGADLLVGKVALELGLPLVAVLPMPLDDYRRDFHGSEGREEFERQLAAADKVIELPVTGGDPAAPVAEEGHARDLQYAQAGVFVSNHCQVLLALWDGREDGPLGGTASIVRYHLTADLPGYDDETESPNLLADNENDLAYHVVCRRDRPDGTPAHGLQPLETYWVTAHFGRQPGNGMPDEYRLMLERLQDFQRDADRHSDEVESLGSSLLAAPLPMDPSPGARLVDRLFRVADGLAIHFQRRVTLGLRATHLIAVLMGLSFILYSEYGGDLLVLAFLGLFFAGLALFLVGESREWHRKYLDYRALAEGLRVQLYWNLAGVVETHSAVFAYDNFLQKQDVDLGWIRHVMRSASLHRDRMHAPDPAWLDWVIGEWVGAPGGTGGQLAYYSGKALQKARVHRRTEWIGNVCLWLGIAVAVGLVLWSDEISEAQQHVLLVLMGVFPLVAAVRSAYAHKKADKELIKQYRFMEQVFANARRLLDSADDPRRRRRVLRALGNAALEEHAEWILVHRERPLEHSRL